MASVLRHLLLLALSLAAAPTVIAGDVSGSVVIQSPVKREEKAPGDAYGARAAPLPGETADRDLHEVQNVVVFIREKVPTSQPPPAANPPASERVYIYQQNTRFRPRAVAVRVGTPVYFKNLDPLDHNVFSLSPAGNFDLGKYPAPHEAKHVFDKPGIVAINCDIHAHMAATVLVLPHPYFAIPDRAGRFRIRGVPPGKYTLVAWHDALPARSKPVTVGSSGDSGADFQF